MSNLRSDLASAIASPFMNAPAPPPALDEVRIRQAVPRDDGLAGRVLLAFGGCLTAPPAAAPSGAVH